MSSAARRAVSWRLAVGSLALGAWACACARTPEPVDHSRDAEATVRRLFDAAGEGDCVALRQLVPSLATEEDCRGYLGEWREQGIALLDIADVRRDGRDRSAYIVRARIRRGGTERDWLVRAARDRDGVWALTL